MNGEGRRRNGKELRTQVSRRIKGKEIQASAPKREGEVGKEKEGEGGGEKGRNDDFKAENISKHFRIIDTS